jgi:predicted unusual protein kinase regulating ubiquinone biosynthesis (AarF/ABC1/UbiB family)
LFLPSWRLQYFQLWRWTLEQLGPTFIKLGV